MQDARFDFARVIEETMQTFDTLGIERTRIPLIVAGGINSHAAVRACLAAGAAGVQLGTPFAVTEEGDAHPNFKRILAEAEPEDIVDFVSVTGLPARAVKTPWLMRYLRNEERIRSEDRRAQANLSDRARLPRGVRAARRHRKVRPLLYRHAALRRVARRFLERPVLSRPRGAAVRIGDPQRA